MCCLDTLVFLDCFRQNKAVYSCSGFLVLKSFLVNCSGIKCEKKKRDCFEFLFIYLFFFVFLQHPSTLLTVAQEEIMALESI